jgi:RNA polymerase sigma factor (sigma-70 family)
VCRADFLDRADASKGRFRALLLAVTRHRMHARIRERSTAKRGGAAQTVPLDEEPASREERDDYDRLWAAHIMRSSLDRVRELNAGYAEAIELHYLKELPYADVAARLGRKEHDVKNFIFQGKKRLKECVEQFIREYCSSPEELREELDELSRFLP